MRVKSSAISLIERSITESLNLDLMQRIVKELLPGYDLYERTGFPSTIPIPNRDAARCILKDIINEDRLVDLVERLVLLDRDGFMGNSYPVSLLRELVKLVVAEGYVYDPSSGLFFEDPSIRRTPNWGRIKDGDEHTMAVLRMDIAGNSGIVRDLGGSAASRAYDEFRCLALVQIEKRGGRLWQWEGDGGLAAFLFGHPTTQAVLSGISILHDLFLYNRFENRLGRSIEVRVAVHVGPLAYFKQLDQLDKQDTIREACILESKYAPVGSLVISPAVVPTLDRVLMDSFTQVKTENASNVVCYSPRREGI